MEKNKKILVYSDGGSRGNPGPAAIGVVLDGVEIGKKDYGEYLGETTNNEAEYRAVIFALKKIKHLIGSNKAAETEVDCYVDSELLARQMNGEYKIKEEGIQKFFLEIWNLKIDFRAVNFHHVPRGQNRGADKIVNQVLDREESKLDI